MTQRLPKPEDTILAGLSQLVQDCLQRIDQLETRVGALEAVAEDELRAAFTRDAEALLKDLT